MFTGWHISRYDRHVDRHVFNDARVEWLDNGQESDAYIYVDDVLFQCVYTCTEFPTIITIGYVSLKNVARN